MTTTPIKKSLGAARVKDADQGIVELVFATFNKVDKDGDVTLKGAFTQGAEVVLSAYGHKSWEGALPYGTGVIRETDTEAVAEVKFLLDTTHGRDAFLTVKALGDLQEWSYSLEDVVSERGTFDGKSVNILKKINVKEVSPVLRGAGTDTRTTAVKADAGADMADGAVDDAPKGAKFSEHFDIALRGVKQLEEMTRERLPLRVAQGKSISEQTEAYEALSAAVASLKAAIDDATQPTRDADEAAREALALLALSVGV